MTDTSDLPQTGGTWVRDADGNLHREEEPTKRPLPHEQDEEAAPEPAPAPAGRRTKPAAPQAPADPVTES